MHVRIRTHLLIEDSIPKTTTSPSFVLAYGPFLYATPFTTCTFTTPLNPPANRLWELPQTEIDHLDFGDEDSIAGLDEERLRFLTISTPLNDEKMHPDLKSMKYLIHGWIPASTRHGHVITYRYPLVKILLSLATQFYSRPLWKVSRILPQGLFLLSRIFGMITDDLNLQAYAIERWMRWLVVLVSFSSLSYMD